MSVRTNSTRILLALAAVLTVAMPTAANAKAHPYNAAFESQVETLFFENGKISSQKVDTYIARLTEKRRQAVSILINADVDKAGQKGKKPKTKEIEKDADESDLAMALDAAIASAKQLKTSTSKAAALASAYDILDFENTVRVLGISIYPIDLIKNVLQSWVIPLSSPAGDEATNLRAPNAPGFLSVGDLEAMKSRGADLSLLSPPDLTEFYQKQNDISQVDVAQAARGQNLDFYKGNEPEFPADSTYFFNKVKHSDTKPKLDTFIEIDGKKRKFKMKFSSEVHSENTAAALFMTMGFPTDVTKFERRVKLILGKNTLSDLKRDWEVFYTRDKPRNRYKIENSLISEGLDPKLGNYVIMRDAIIEARQKNVSRLNGWASGDLGNRTSRDVRGLVFLQMFIDNTDYTDIKNNTTLVFDKDGVITKKTHIVSDLGHAFGALFSEDADSYAPRMVKSRNDKEIKMDYRSFVRADVKNQMTYADAKWATRLLAQLTRPQIEKAVELGGWPTCVGSIFTEKMILRRNDAVRNFGLVNERLPNGKAIQLMPEKDPKTLMFKDNCDAKALTSDYSTDFKFDMTDALRTLGRMAASPLADTSRALLNSIKQIRIEPARIQTTKGFGINPALGPVVEAIISFPRTIERNPAPESEQDLWIVKDEFEIGLRLGVKFGIYKDVVLTRKFTIAYPVRSRQDARASGNFLVDPLLPLHLRAGKVPAKYVLKAETFLSSGIGVELINFEAPVVSPGIKIGKDRVLLGRAILDARDQDKVLLYRDQSIYTQSIFEIFARVNILKLPIYNLMSGQGSSEGRALTLKRDSAEKNPKVADALAAAVANGDFTPFEAAEQKLTLNNDFNFKRKAWSLLLWKGKSEQRFDHVQLTEPEGAREKLQLRSTRSNLGGLFSKNTNTMQVEVSGDSIDKTAKKVTLKTVATEANTSSEELEARIDSMNALALDGKKMIDFKPSLGFSANEKWGTTVNENEVEIYEKGLAKIMKMTESELWSSLAREMALTNAQMASEIAMYKAERSVDGDQTDLQKDHRSLIDHARDVLSELKKLAQSSTAEKSYDRIARLFRQSTYRVKKTYEPRLLKALLKIAGSENVYSRHLIGVPSFAEVNLLGEVPLVGEQGKRRGGGSEYIILSPQTPLDLYNMFDSWF